MRNQFMQKKIAGIKQLPELFSGLQITYVQSLKSIRQSSNLLIYLPESLLTTSILQPIVYSKCMLHELRNIIKCQKLRTVYETEAYKMSWERCMRRDYLNFGVC